MACGRGYIYNYLKKNDFPKLLRKRMERILAEIHSLAAIATYMSKPLIILTVFLSLSLSSWGQRKVWTGYRVYNAVLNSEKVDSAASVVILDHVEVETHSSGLVEAIKSGNRQMMHFYTKTNVDSATLQLIVEYFGNQEKQTLELKSLYLPVKVYAISKAAVDKMFKQSVEKGWRGFYKKYPNSAGLFSFSKVHFSKDVTKAVFYYSHQQAGLKGYGELVVMEKVSDRWQVKYQFSLWYS